MDDQTLGLKPEGVSAFTAGINPGSSTPLGKNIRDTV
jgi:hypothetical protein